MQIKDFGVNPAINGAARGGEAKKQVNPDAFFNLMKERIKQAQNVEPKAPSQAVEAASRADEIGAVAARSRMIQTKACNDVTDFLGLIKENRYLLRGVDVGALELDESVTGTGALSVLEISALKRAYDTATLSPERQAELLKKLNALGAVSADDVRSAGKSVTPAAGDLMDYLVNEPDFKNVSSAEENDPKARLRLMIQNERYVAGHVSSRYGQKVTAVSNLADSHERLLSALNKI